MTIFFIITVPKELFYVYAKLDPNGDNRKKIEGIYYFFGRLYISKNLNQFKILFCL